MRKYILKTLIFFTLIILQNSLSSAMSSEICEDQSNFNDPSRLDLQLKDTSTDLKRVSYSSGFSSEGYHRLLCDVKKRLAVDIAEMVPSYLPISNSTYDGTFIDFLKESRKSLLSRGYVSRSICFVPAMIALKYIYESKFVIKNQRSDFNEDKRICANHKAWPPYLIDARWFSGTQSSSFTAFQIGRYDRFFYTNKYLLLASCQHKTNHCL